MDRVSILEVEEVWFVPAAPPSPIPIREVTVRRVTATYEYESRSYGSRNTRFGPRF